MRILIFGGTTEGRILAEKLCMMHHSVTVSCATEQGTEELLKIPCEKRCGRMDAAQMEKIIPEFDLILDATHPYASEASKNIRDACAQIGKPMRRILRSESETEGCILADTCKEAAEMLKSTEGNILIATGAKELSQFSTLPPERLFIRVLPTMQSLAACESLKIPHRNILALYGPFSTALNLAIMQQYAIRWMVTKDSGTAGGFPEKMEAARAINVGVIVVKRPKGSGISMEEFLNEVEKCGFN